MIKITTKIYQIIKDIIIKNRRAVLTLIHIVQAALAYYLAFVLRFESISIPAAYLYLFLYCLPILLSIRLIFYVQAGLHKDLWRYSSVSDLIKIIRVITIGNIVFFIVIRYLIGDTSYPRSIYILDGLLLIIISGGSRLFIRVFREYVQSQPSGKKVLIVGAGNPAEAIVRDMKKNPESSYEPIGFIDEDPYKKGLKMHGIPIFGQNKVIPEVIKKHEPDEVLISIPSVSSSIVREVYELCKPFNITIKKLPELNKILDDNTFLSAKIGQRLIDANIVTEVQIQEALALQKKEGGRLGSKLVKLGYMTEEKLVSFLIKYCGIPHMKPISLEDLLQREPVRTNIKSVKDFINGKSVMVTGAGGSIGSELCRQIIKYNPSNLILLDRYENSLYELDLELNGWENGRLRKKITTIVGDILDTSRLEYLFSKYKPQIIFHAAAHKHVPLMEYNPIEAVKNNIFGTKNLIETATRHNIESFVTISTDKAVNPTSIMGATKRIAELLTITENSTANSKFTTVRFGNVLGSNGSVVHVFKEQLKDGGPLTVTHPEIKRFFMIISEAVQLVLIAAASGIGGEIFVLDMGKQIKIVDLAENLIRLSGFIPNDEIRIEFTGIRPGEKLYEELFDKSEKIIPTFHEKLKIANPEIPSIDNLKKQILELERIVLNNSVDDVMQAIHKIVSSFNHEHISKLEHTFLKH